MSEENKFEKGKEVFWKWGGGRAHGRIADIIEEGAAKATSNKGKVVTRKARSGDPAVKIAREGNDVVKLAHELDEVDEK